MSSRAGLRVTGCALIAAAVLVGCGGDDAETSAPALTDGIPADAVLVAAVTVDPEDEQSAQIEEIASTVLGSDDAGATIRAPIEQALAQADPPVDYSEQIEPWLGEQLLAWYSTLDGPDQEFALLTQVDNTDEAQDFVEVAAGEGAESGDYEGVEYRVTPEDGYRIGIVDELFVLGTPGGFERTVDTLGGGARLEDAALDEQLSGDALATAFLNLDEIAGQTSGADPAELERARSLLPGFFEQPVTLSLATGEDTISLDAAFGSLGAFGGARSESAVLRELPADSIVAVGGADIGAAYEQLLELVSQDGEEAAEIDRISRQFERQAGVTLDRALAAIGDGALFIRGSSPDAVEGGLLLESLDPAVTARLIDAAVGAARRQGERLGGLPPAVDAESGFTIAATDADLPFDLVVAQRDDRVAIGSPAAVAQLLDPAETLESAEYFDEATTALGDNLSLAGYADLHQVGALLRTFADGDPEVVLATQYLSHLPFLVYGVTDDGETATARVVVGVE